MEKWWQMAGVGLAAVGLTWAMVGVVLAGAVAGAALSFVVLAGSPFGEKVKNAAGGMVLSLFATPVVGAYMEVKLVVFGLIALVIALYGLAVLREGQAFIQSGGLRQLRDSLVQRFFPKKEGS